MTKATKRTWAYRLEDMLMLLAHMGLEQDEEIYKHYQAMLSRAIEIQGNRLYTMRLVPLPDED